MKKFLITIWKLLISFVVFDLVEAFIDTVFGVKFPSLIVGIAHNLPIFIFGIVCGWIIISFHHQLATGDSNRQNGVDI